MNEQTPTPIKYAEWKSVTVRLKENELAILNSKLKLNGFDTFSQFVHAWIKGQYPEHEITNKLKISLKELETEA